MKEETPEPMEFETKDLEDNFVSSKTANEDKNEVDEGESERTVFISSGDFEMKDPEGLNCTNSHQLQNQNNFASYWKCIQNCMLPALVVLPLLIFGWRETLRAWYIPLLAIFAAAFPSGGAPIAGGILFVPMLIRTGVQPKQAVAFSAAVQTFGCGIFAPLNWTSMNPRILIFEILYVSLIPGVLGCITALVILPMPAQSIEIFFSVFCIFLAIYVIYGLFHNLTTNNEEVIMTPKAYAIYSLSCFCGGLVTGWIGIGIEKVVFVLLTAFPHRANIRRSSLTAIAIVGWVSSFSLVIHLAYLKDVPLLLWCCAIPGVLVGARLGPKINKLLGSRNMMIIFILMLLYDSSVKLQFNLLSH